MPASSPAPEPMISSPTRGSRSAWPSRRRMVSRSAPGRAGQVVRPGPSGHRLVPVAEMVEAQRRQPGRPRARQQRRQAGPVRIQRIEPQRAPAAAEAAERLPGREQLRRRRLRRRRAAGRGRYTGSSAPPAAPRRRGCAAAAARARPEPVRHSRNSGRASAGMASASTVRNQARPRWKLCRAPAANSAAQSAGRASRSWWISSVMAVTSRPAARTTAQPTHSCRA